MLDNACKLLELPSLNARTPKSENRDLVLSLNTALASTKFSKKLTYHKSIAFVHDSLDILTIESRVVSKLVVQLRIQLASGYQSKDPDLMSLHIKA